MIRQIDGELIALTNCKIFTGQTYHEDKSILIKNGKVMDIVDKIPEQARKINLDGKNISPGFIDIQINGGKQYYFANLPNKTTLEDIYTTQCEFGTPYIMPTLISSSLDRMLQAIETVRQFKKQHSGVLGLHLEGPYLNSKRRGAHSIEMVRKPTDDELKLIIEKGKGVVKVMTIAPQCFSDQQLNLLMENDILLSIGHTDMNYDQAQHYFGKGINLVTHLYNAMTQMGQRECGTVGAIFDNENVYASIILDGGHLHYAAARIAYKQKGNKLFLITDSSFLGRSKTQFGWDGWNIQMVDGFYRDKQNNLAGAAISMPEAVRNAKQNLNISLKQAVQMATSRVSRAIKMEKEIGFIKQGYPAVFTVFDDNLKKAETFIYK